MLFIYRYLAQWFYKYSQPRTIQVGFIWISIHSHKFPIKIYQLSGSPDPGKWIFPSIKYKYTPFIQHSVDHCLDQQSYKCFYTNSSGLHCVTLSIQLHYTQCYWLTAQLVSCCFANKLYRVGQSFPNFFQRGSLFGSENFLGNPKFQ